MFPTESKYKKGDTMLSAKNYYGRLVKLKPKQDHFSLRKLSIGLISVTIGITLYLGGENSYVMADTNLRDNNNQQLAGSGNGTNIRNDKVQIPTGAFQSKQMQTENCKVNNQMSDKTEVTNSAKNSSTLNVENSETADLSRFDYSLYTKKVQSFKFSNSGNNNVIRTVILNKPTGVETVTMTLDVNCSSIKKRKRQSHTSTRSSIYKYIPRVIADVNTSNNPSPKISILWKNVLPKTSFQVDKNTFLTQQDKENYEKFISVNKNDISIELPAFNIDDIIDVPGYSYHINAEKTTPGAGLGKEKFYIYTEQPQKVVIDYTPITVKVEHKIITVTPTDPKTPSDKLPDNPGKNYPKGVDKTDLNKTITRKITVIKPDGTKEAHDQTVNLTRTATVDEVTGKVTYRDWVPETWDNFDVPAVSGYTPSQSNVPKQSVTDGTKDTTVTITYTPNEQTGKITYVDPNGKEVGTTLLTGKTDEKIPVTPNVPAGWQVVPDQKIPTTITATPDGITTVTVKVEHKIITVTPTDPKTPSDKLPDNPGKNYPKGVDKTDLNKTITRKITVIKPDGTKEAHDQTVNLTRTATVDEVTGKVTYRDWTTGNFGEYDAPEIPGYTLSGNAPAVALVTSTSDFTPVVITYIPTNQLVKYKFVDPQGKVVGVQTVPGKTGQTVPVNIHIPDGYQLVPGESVPTSYTFKDGNPDQIIKVSLIPTNDHQGQGTPATNTPANTTPNGNAVTGKLEGNVPNMQTGKTITSQPTTAKDNQLPQTGNDNSLTLMGLGASTLLGMFGLAAVNKKRK